jgi:Flp pilus assembly protein TadD
MIVLLAFSACQTSLPKKSTENYKTAVSAFYIGLAALQVGDDQRANQELVKASELANGEPAIWNNLGVLQLRQKDFEASAKSLETAKNLAPENATIYSNIAVLETQRGNFDKAIENLNKAIELNPKDVRSIYALAREKERQNDDADAQKLYQRILQEKQGNLAIQLDIARLAAKQNDTETLKKIVIEIAPRIKNANVETKEQFANLQKSVNENELRQATTQVTYLRNILLRLPEFRGAIAEVQSSNTSLGELFEKPLKLPTPDFSPAEPDTALTFSAQMSENVKANFAKAIFLNGENPPAIAWSDEKETHIGKTILPVSLSNPNQIIAFDFDFDFKNDLAIATEKGFRLFRQIGDGNFEDVTIKTKLSEEILQKSFSGVWTPDIESDGDLDLILASEIGAPIVLQNSSDGSFSALKVFENVQNLREFAWADLDEDGDSDAITLDSAGKVQFFSNERGGIFKERNLPKFNEASAITVGDANGDGKIDLIVLDGNSFIRITNTDNENNFETVPFFLISNDLFCGKMQIDSKDKGGLGIYKICSLQLADFDNNGANDFAVSDSLHTQFLLGGKDANFLQSKNKISGQITTSADINGDGKLDLIGVGAEEKPTIVQNDSTKNYHWQILRPKAAKTEGDQRVNTFGIGGEMEIRSGLLAQKQLINSPQVHFGLGENESVDVLRVVWGNGYVQAEFDLKADQTVAAEQRLKGSCPHLFTWNGSEFALVKDAPPWSPALGLKINAQDTYGVLQTEEWFKIPGESLKPKNGFYELRISAEYWESFYVDNYKLLAVDHPENTEIFTDERFAIPLPPLKVFTTEITQNFASAKNDKSEDVAEIVKNLDEKYLDSIERGKFQGVAKDHFVELELPENAPKDKKVWLVADGWTHPTDASINVQRGQIPGVKPPKSLSLEIQDESGNWKTFRENLGFPAGKMKTVLIDLPENVRKFRLRTEIEIFWDKLAWAIDLPENQTKEIAVELSSAELRYRGFSVIEKADDSSPEKPIYDQILTTNQRWRDLEGFYTRFGDVLELLQKTDDRYVLANAGDEIVLKYPSLPEVEKGWKRDFVIIGNGWIKDGDLNSVFSKTLLPLPTHSTNDYSKPPTTLENDPVYQKHKEDWLKFHTRYVAPNDFINALR